MPVTRFGSRGQFEGSPFQSFVQQKIPGSIPYQNLDSVPPAIQKHKEVTTQRRLADHASRGRRQTIEAPPQVDELVRFEYLSSWKVEKTANRKDYKVVFFHGRKFRTDLLTTGETLEVLDSVKEEDFAADDFEERSSQDSSALPRSLLEELTGRGVGRRAAKALVNELPEGDEALRLLEWADAEISRKRPGNPAGFLIHLIREKVAPPRDFLSSRQLRELQEREQANREEQEKRARTHDEYQSFVRDQVDARLRDHSKTEYLERLERKKQELVKKYAVLASSPTRTVEESAERALRDEIQREMPLPTMEEFLSIRGESVEDRDPDTNG